MVFSGYFGFGNGADLTFARVVLHGRVTALTADQPIFCMIDISFLA